ncbi:MAG: hypothetical protein HQM06_01545 [Magnetococcales bacterium]|nr:hypothetical protein [Magnetococcales bacterium]
MGAHDRFVWLLFSVCLCVARPAAAVDIRCGEVQANTAIGERLYGPTRPGESLTTIARPMAKKLGVSPFQAQVVIWQRNAGQFVLQNMHGLKSGCQLVIPAAEEFTRISPESAGNLLLAHAIEWRKPYSARKTMTDSFSATDKDTTNNNKAFSEERPVLQTPESADSSQNSARMENFPIEQITSRLQSIVQLLEKNQHQMDSLMQRVSAMESKQEMFKQFDQRLSVLEGRLK